MYTTGVPLSPLPDVKSQSEPIRSVNLLGVVPWDSIEPTRFAFLLFMWAFIASFNASPSRCAKLLSAKYFNLTSFGKTAEFCSKYYKKGQQVLVEGRIQNRTWEDDKGQKRYATDFIVEQCYFADSSKNTNDTEAPANDFVTVKDDEDLPF